MIVKEKLARKMVCPVGQACPGITVRCSGSSCMAWRFFDDDGAGFCGMVPADADPDFDSKDLDSEEF